MARENLIQELLSQPSEHDGSLRIRVCTESKKLWVVAGPAIFNHFATMGVMGITQALLGHVGTTELAAFALSNVMDSLAVGVLLGMASALETLCGQSYGSEQYHMLGIYLQQSWIILLATAIITLPLFLFTSPLMRLLGQDPLISDVAGLISLWYISVVFSNVFSFTFQLYLQSQSKNSIISYFSLISITLHVVLSWVSVIKLQWGISGAMVSMTIALWIPVIRQFSYLLCGGCPQTWKGFTRSAFSDLWPIVKLSLSSGAMICFNISVWEIMISLGFLAATGVRVANELGAGNAKAAKFSIVVATAMSTVIGFVVILIFLCFRKSIVYLFTTSDVVADAVLDLTPLLVLNLFLYSIQPVLLGAAVGAGW
ncbi:Protein DETOXIFICATION [Rhynchospora pubera]|uniref:Protein DETOXIFICATION n=1 Tax=Rhynchospora pubera TaxID=906938 RepID=A0AAV8ECD4_9POAL|nr:Protein DETOXIFICATION [Rhynchospora pubera]